LRYAISEEQLLALVRPVFIPATLDWPWLFQKSPSLALAKEVPKALTVRSNFLPICGKTLKSCFAGFTIHNLLNNAITTLPASARSWNFFPPDGVQYGKHIFHLYVLAYDVNGAEVHSTPAQVVIDVVPPPSAATSFTGVLQ
jgi:hypothetical protein